jgi:colicin import membrane protein
MRSRHFLAFALLAVADAALGQDLNLVSSVEVRDEGASVVLSVKGTKPPNFTTFSMADPPRFVLDLSEARFQGVPEDLAVNDGTILVVKNLSYGSAATSIARIMIAFAVDVEPPEVQTQGTSLVVRVAKPGAAAGAAVAKVDEGQRAREQAEAERRAQTEAAEAQARADAEAKARADAQAQAGAAQRAQEETAARAKAEVETQPRADAETSAAAEVQAKAAEAAALLAAEEARKAEARAAKDESERQRQEAIASAKTEAEQKRQAELERKAEAKRQREEAVAQAKAEAARKKQEEAERKAEAKRQREEAAAQAKAEAAQKKQEEAERRAEAKQQREEAVGQAKAEAARKKQEEAERKAEAKRQREEERRARADARLAEAQARQDAIVEAGPPPAQLREIGFRQVAGGSRVFVRTSVPPRFTIQDVGENMIRVELENTRVLRRNDARFLDTSFFSSAVALITPSRHGSSYVVDIKLKQKVPYQQRVEGDMLAIDFERPAEAAGAEVPAAADADPLPAEAR